MYAYVCMMPEGTQRPRVSADISCKARVPVLPKLPRNAGDWGFIFLNQARAGGHVPGFLNSFSCEYVCMCVCVCVHAPAAINN